MFNIWVTNSKYKLEIPWTCIPEILFFFEIKNDILNLKSKQDLFVTEKFDQSKGYVLMMDEMIIIHFLVNKESYLCIVENL